MALVEGLHAQGTSSILRMGDAAAGDFCFAADPLSIGECGDEMYIGYSRRKDPAADGQDLARNVYGFGKSPGDMRECCEE